MNKLIRKTHLVLGLGVTPFLFIYALSALMMAHHPLSPARTYKQVTELTLSEIHADPVRAAEALTAEHGVRGQLQGSAVAEDGTMTLRFAHPGEHSEVVIDPASGAARLTVGRANTPGFVVALHETAGASEGPIAQRLWGVVVLAVGGCLVGIVVTGFLMWLERPKERRTGVILLGASLLYCVGILTVIRLGG